MKHVPGLYVAEDHRTFNFVSQLVPCSDGTWRAPYQVATSSYNSIGAGTANIVFDATLAILPSGSKRLIAGTATKLFEINTGTNVWADISSGAYTTTTGWSFCQLGVDTYAANKENALQKSSTSGAFVAQGSAPKSLVVDTMEGALAHFNCVIDGVDTPDGVVISDIGNPSEYTPDQDLATLAYRTRLTELPGDITAAKRFRNWFVVFKKRGMWILQHVGAPKIWDVQLYSADVGCVGKNACVVGGDRLYFMDDNLFYSFDGGQVQVLPVESISRSVTKNMAAVGQANLGLSQLHYDDINGLVSLYRAVSVPNRYFDSAWVYSVMTGEFGYIYPTEAVVVTAPTCLLNCSQAAIRALTGSPSLFEPELENRMAFTYKTIPTLVSLLLHCDGINGSTTFTDSSTYGHTATAVGNAQVSTTSPKFGTGKMLLDGTGDWCTVPASAAFAFGTGDCTIAGWAESPTTGGTKTFITQNASSSAANNLTIRLLSASAVVVFEGTTVISGAISGLGDGNFHYLAFSRVGNTARLFWDGAQVGSDWNCTGATIWNAGTGLIIGAGSGGVNEFRNAIDDLVIVKGSGLYSASFTPPVAAYTDPVSDTNTFQNGHGILQVGTCTTARWGNPSMAYRITRLYMQAQPAVFANIPGPPGLMVSLAASRGLYGSTTQSTASADFGANFNADLVCTGNYFQATYTVAQSATFVKWSDVIPEARRAGRY